MLGILFALHGLAAGQSGPVELSHSLRFCFGLSDPLSPRPFRENWRTGLSADLSFQASMTGHVEFTAGAGYTVFRLNSRRLSSEFNHTSASSASFAFERGAYRLGLLHAGLNVHFGSVWKPVSYFLRAEGVLALAHQDDMILVQEFGGQKVRERIELGADEAAPGAVAAVGAKIRVDRRVFFVLSADACVLRTSDRVGDSDLAAFRLSRAQGENTVFTTFRAGLDIQY
ncbi:hypothetical protein JW777_09505 [bacterium]|nr:hypothetical protein [bacterium]